ncbi:MAG: hypothetical protein M9890_14520 [Thermomicrobiales bacterium]|nr:hypothetical protein [Thermomicrobiales bacterium]
MYRTAIRLSIALIFLGVIVACSGPSRRDATPVVVESPAPIVPTAPRIVETPVMPTVATVEPTATVIPTQIPMSTPTPRATPTPTPEVPPSAIESALLAMLPSDNTLPTGWELISANTLRGRPTGSLLCGIDPFPGAAKKLGAVESEYQRVDAPSLSVIQELTAYRDPDAVAAMDWARESLTCSNWTDSDGSRIELSPFEEADIGDEALVADFTVVVDASGRLHGRWYLIRRGGIIAQVATVSDVKAAIDESPDVVGMAVELLDPQRLAAATIDPAVQSSLVGMMLHADDIGPGWLKRASGPNPDPAFAAFCGIPLFGEAGEPLGDSFAVFEQADTGWMVRQRLVALPSNEVQSAMDGAAQALTCGEWTDADGVIYTLEQPQPALGAADGVIVRFQADRDGEVRFGAISVTQIGAIMNAVVVTAPEPPSPDIVLAIIQRATDDIHGAG